MRATWHHLGGITEYLFFGLRGVPASKRYRCVLTYGGDITALESWEILSQNKDAVLIDVRTNAEWAYVGVPSLNRDMTPLVGQQWQLFPNMAVDPDFVEKLSNTLSEMQLGHDAKLCFLCRSGVRSLAAAKAMWERGFKNSYNISGGFEGDLNKESHRGQKNGWKAENLPWQQG